MFASSNSRFNARKPHPPIALHVKYLRVGVYPEESGGFLSMQPFQYINIVSKGGAGVGEKASFNFRVTALPSKNAKCCTSRKFLANTVAHAYL